MYFVEYTYVSLNIALLCTQKQGMLAKIDKWLAKKSESLSEKATNFKYKYIIAKETYVGVCGPTQNEFLFSEDVYNEVVAFVYEELQVVDCSKMDFLMGMWLLSGVFFFLFFIFFPRVSSTTNSFFYLLSVLHNSP